MRIAVLLLIAAVLALPAAAGATELRIITWNIEGPAGLDNKDLASLGTFVQSADIVVVEEVLGEDQLKAAMAKAGLSGWNYAVSDFAKDALASAYSRQEVAVITPHAIGTVVEVDPWPNDDTPEMRAKDEDFQVPDWIPAAQRAKKGSRGWLWVEIPSLKLAVAAVHLKSSRGKFGHEDKENSNKREAVAAGLATRIRDDGIARKAWSHVVAGDFNVAPGDAAKVGVDLTRPCTPQDCRGYDQTHAIFGAGLVDGLVMRNLVVGLSASYAKGAFIDSPIDNIYARGPLFDKTTKMILERGSHFGADHYAVSVTLTRP